MFYPEKPGIGGSKLITQTDKKIITSTDVCQQQQQLNLPGWLAFDRMVLRFYAFFQESDSIRKCNIFYYLADDTIQVSEPNIENSGLPQGTLIRRSRIIRNDDDDQHFLVTDFNVGQEIIFYSRTFKIVGCDKFTREFLNAKLNMTVPENTHFPVDPYEQHRNEIISRQTARHTVDKEFALKKFLENDRRVLRFFCVWDDTNMAFGDVRHMELHYYVADDTMEIREKIPANAGRDPNPLFLKRGRMPKNPHINPVNGPAPKINPNDYYNERDLTIGSVLQFYGRPFVIVDCDQFTKDYYHARYGVDVFDPVRLEEYNRFVLFDSLSSTDQEGEQGREREPLPSLIPTAPKKDFRKAMMYDGVILRYAARLESNKQVDRDRKFTISYNMANETMSVFEPPQRNTGLTGGKFLESRRCKRDGTTIDPNSEFQAKPHEYYGPKDFKIGNKLVLAQHSFVIVDADQFAKNFEKANPQLF